MLTNVAHGLYEIIKTKQKEVFILVVEGITKCPNWWNSTKHILHQIWSVWKCLKYSVNTKYSETSGFNSRRKWKEGGGKGGGGGLAPQKDYMIMFRQFVIGLIHRSCTVDQIKVFSSFQ